VLLYVPSTTHVPPFKQGLGLEHSALETIQQEEREQSKLVYIKTWQHFGKNIHVNIKLSLLFLYA